MTAPMGRVLRLTRENETLPEADVVSLLEQLRAGKYLQPLIAEIVAFRQADGERNWNHVRFTPAALARLAASFNGRPLLRDHDQFDVRSIAGRVLETTLSTEDDGAQVIRQTLEVIKPWAQEGILDGTIRNFSIGWHANDRREPYCSID